MIPVTEESIAQMARGCQSVADKNGEYEGGRIHLRYDIQLKACYVAYGVPRV